MRITKKSAPIPDCEVAPGLLGYREIDVTAEAGEFELAYRTTATVAAEVGRYVVTKMTVEQVEGGPPIQRGELAKISVEPFIYTAASEILESRVDGKGKKTLGSPVPNTEFWDRIMAAGGLTDSDLPELARLYRFVRLQEGTPTAILAKELNLSTATVKRWLAKAVDAGYLTQEERTK
ncbi:hypothetical protein FXW78_07095 [Rhodococcus opacus]|nr:hypothetical protein [Rhodococcus opacus]